jgi:hypothetical protein
MDIIVKYRRFMYLASHLWASSMHGSSNFWKNQNWKKKKEEEEEEEEEGNVPNINSRNQNYVK